MGRTKGSKNKKKILFEAKTDGTKPNKLAEVTGEQILEASIILAESQLPKELEGYYLYKALSDAGFPQGGVGNWMYDENGNNKVYIPHPSEVYNQFIADPKEWELMSSAMSLVWLKNRK